MSMLLPSRHEAASPWVVVASSAATASSSSSTPAVDHHHYHNSHTHSHIPAPHASKLHQLQYQQQQQHYQDDKALGAGMTINMQSVVDADARRPHRYLDAREDHLAVLPPPLASSGSPATISPPNTRRYPPVLAPLRVLPDYCRFPGCANFGKMQGFCHDHIHGRAAAAGAIAPVVSRPLLPGLRSVVSPDTAMSSPEPSSSPSVAFGAFQPSLYPPSTLKRPLPPPVMIPAVPQSAFAAVSKRPRVLDESDSSSSTASTAKVRSVKCRRENCGNDARRKGLCMEHGGRHFCKMAGCTKCAHRGGFCISHGGGRRCAVANCAKSAQSGGICYSHGGGKRCATDGCSHAARSGGYCIKHGKQQRLQH